MLAVSCVVAAVALLAACGGGDGEGPGGVELPEGFPQDFPVYAGATIEEATVAPEGGRFLAEWRSTESTDQVRAFYEKELDEEPWQVENTQEIPGIEALVIEFARRDPPEQRGTVVIAPTEENGQYVTIALSVNAPQ